MENTFLPHEFSKNAKEMSACATFIYFFNTKFKTNYILLKDHRTEEPFDCLARNSEGNLLHMQ